MFNANVINPARGRGGESLVTGAGAGGTEGADMGFIEFHIEVGAHRGHLDSATANKIESVIDRQNERAAQLASERQRAASANRRQRREALLQRLRTQDESGWELISDL